MQTETNHWKPQEDTHSSHKCNECGENFQKPLLATLSSSGTSQVYYACPRCLTKVDLVQVKKTEELPRIQRENPKMEMPSDKNQNCPQFFGYLGKRARDVPIPDGCLTCGKMVECLVRQTG